MPWLIIILGYFLGSIPTAYVAGHILKGVDIRQIEDKNMGAANVFRQLNPKAGVAVGLVNVGKGTLAILIAQAANMPQIALMFTGAAAVIGHNWPVFIGFRGGRGGKYYHWRAANGDNSADANSGRAIDFSPAYQKKRNPGLCFHLCSATTGMLVAGNSWVTDYLQHSATWPGGLHSLPQGESTGNASSVIQCRNRM